MQMFSYTRLWVMSRVRNFIKVIVTTVVFFFFTLWNLMTLIYNVGRRHVQENTSVSYLFSSDVTVEEFNGGFFPHKYLNL